MKSIFVLSLTFHSGLEGHEAESLDLTVGAFEYRESAEVVQDWAHGLLHPLVARLQETDGTSPAGTAFLPAVITNVLNTTSSLRYWMGSPESSYEFSIEEVPLDGRLAVMEVNI